MSVEDSSKEYRGRFFELMSVGLRPYDTARYSENAFRATWPCDPHLSYDTS